MKKILTYYHHNIWPPRNGDYRVCLRLLEALAKAGHELHFASSDHLTPWSADSEAALLRLGFKGVYIYRYGRIDKIYLWLKHLIFGEEKLEPWRRGHKSYSWLMRCWFTRLRARLLPDVVIINYAFCDTIFDHEAGFVCDKWLQMFDLYSVNVQLQNALNEGRRQFLENGTPGKYFDMTGKDLRGYVPAASELEIYNKYDTVITVSDRDRELIKQQYPQLNVVWIPIHIEPVNVRNLYDGAPIFMASAHTSNQQALSIFVNRVLYLVRRAIPAFELSIYGDIERVSYPIEGLKFHGFQHESSEIWKSAGFFIFPLISGTGQHTKIIEAMSHGLAIVGFACALRGSPAIHGTNALIASTEIELAEHIVRLWGDRVLCSTLGASARRTIAAIPTQYSNIDALLEKKSAKSIINPNNRDVPYQL